MKWNLPGTVLEVELEHPEAAGELLSALFVAGGLVLSQVCQITGLEPYTVQNWVKRGFLTPPEKKKYTRRQLCRIIVINMLKTEIPMEAICRLLSYVNGKLDCESDDIIDDSVMYFTFLRLAARCMGTWPPENLQNAMDDALSGYTEPWPGARQRVENALEIMLTAWFSSQLQKKAVSQLTALGL